MNKIALFVTYTMIDPVVGGAFMRALRLATELGHRGWGCVICNHGPELRDPKITAAPASVRIITLDRERPGLTVAAAGDEFRALKPSVVVMGETPFECMELFYQAAQGLNCPFIVLDQLYYPSLLPPHKGVDLLLLYALASFWNEELHLPAPYEITPPFIESVRRKSDLPVPPELHDSAWITFVAYDARVCKTGMELLAKLEAKQAVIIAISPDVEECRGLACQVGLCTDRLVTLPLQDDATVFGFFGASAVSVVSNGFLQIMEVLAMGCPVIALDRGSGVGMCQLNIAPQFVPYASFNETMPQQIHRMRQWLTANPIPAELDVRLRSERYGCSHCANRIEQVYDQWNSKRVATDTRHWTGWK
jgi:hypothetical protein